MEGERRQSQTITGGNTIKSSNDGNSSVNISAASSNLQDSEFTVDSNDGNAYNGGTTGWLSSMGADFRNIAHCLTDNVGPVVSGVASMVHRTAVAVANEIAQLEQDEDSDSADSPKTKSKSSPHQTSVSAKPAKRAGKNLQSLMLPWEIKHETASEVNNCIPVYFTDNALMEEILTLSAEESTFLKPYQENSGDDSLIAEEHNFACASMSYDNHESMSVFSSHFKMDEGRINLIQRLMDIDKNLATMHSRFSGKKKIQEELFWKNYFYHCEEVRKERLGRSDSAGHSTTTATSSPEFAVVVKTIATDADMRRKLERVVSSIAGDDDDYGDDESLIPAESASEADDSSYVIASAPNSVNTFSTSKSIDDLVVINPPADSRGKR